MSSVDYSLLHIYTDDLNLRCTARVYDGTIAITGGGGGWVSVPRPLNAPVSVWRGPQDVYAMNIPLVFDKFASDNSVEDECRVLEKMCGQLVNPVEQPPLLILNANGGIPNDVYNFPQGRWVIQDAPDLADQLRRDLDGARSRQVFTVTFMKYTAYDELTRSKQAEAAKPAHTTISKAGDTYNKIAARTLKQYGGQRWGNRLAQLNGAKDGAAKVQPGQLVTLPTASDIKTWQHTTRR